MTKKILFLGAGSKSDPGFGDVYKENIDTKEIVVIDKVIESCHGCYDIMSDYSRQMQSLAEDGNRVVAILEGGLLFGLPSIQAIQTTFPIISLPLDLVAFQGIMVPSGHAVVAGVGVDKKGENKQRIKSLKLAERILNLEYKKVGITEDASGVKLIDDLHEFIIESYRDSSPSLPEEKSFLTLAYSNEGLVNVNSNAFLIRADSDENVNSWEYLMRAEGRHHIEGYNVVPTAQVRGRQNLVIYAAKILSLQRPDLIDRIKEISYQKYKTYDKRDLTENI